MRASRLKAINVSIAAAAAAFAVLGYSEKDSEYTHLDMCVCDMRL